MQSRRLWETDFLNHGRYLRNWTEKTCRTYAQGLKTLPDDLTKETLAQWVINLRGRGVSPAGVNMYARTVNSYLTWLHQEGHLPTRLRVRLLRAPHRQITLLDQNDIRRILRFSPHGRIQRRTWTLILLLLDTGVRIDEALGLERAKLDLEACTLVVFGKGRKERAIPFSLHLRKHLWTWVRSCPARGMYIFPTFHGLRQSARNAYRDIKTLCRVANLRGRVHPHLFRHQFAANYIRQGGDIYRLSRLLGHTSISTTQTYLRGLGVEDVRSGLERLTPLRLSER
jgi:integrase/recombinase XerD